jgi:AraC-like DNA-binding protein
MKRRCLDPKVPGFKDYGGRGIVVCDRWLESFENFHADMGQRPSPQHQLNRIDNDGPYTPENCCWSTVSEQARNRRSNHLITHNGVTLTLAAWAEQAGISLKCLSYRLKAGWSMEQALQPADRHRSWSPERREKDPAAGSARRLLTFQGETCSVNEWARRTGLSSRTLRSRLRAGWSVEKTLTTPLVNRS